MKLGKSTPQNVDFGELVVLVGSTGSRRGAIGSRRGIAANN